MKLNIKEYFKLSVIYTVIAALPSLLQTLSQPFIVGEGKLNSTDFSHLAITEIITSFVFVVCSFAMGNAISRFYYDYIEDKKGYNKLVSGIFNSILIRGALLLLISLFIGKFIGNFFSQKELKDFSTYGYASVIFGINRAICMTAFALYRNEKQVGKFILFNISLALLRTGFQLAGLFFYDMTFIGYVYGSCIGSGITTIGILVYTYYHSGFHFDPKFLKPLNKFAFPLFVYGLISWGLMYAGRFFLEDSPKELGIYYTAVNFALGIQLVLQGIQGATQPEVFRFMMLGIKEHHEEIKKLSNMLLVQTQALIAIAIIPCMLYLTLFYKSDVKMASSIIGIIFIDFILKSQYFVFALPLYYLKKTNFLFVINSSALIINLGLNYLFTHYFHFKANGLIGAMLFSDFILTIGIYFYQNKLIHIKWNIQKVMTFPLIVTVLTIIIEIIKNIFNLNQYIASVSVVLIISIFMFILYRKEIRAISSKFRVSGFGYKFKNS